MNRAIGIIGNGSIGKSFASQALDYGDTVIMVVRKEEERIKLKASGLTVIAKDKHIVLFPVDDKFVIVSSIKELQEFQLNAVLIATKTTVLSKLTDALVLLLNHQATIEKPFPILLAQNGMGNEEQLGLCKYKQLDNCYHIIPIVVLLAAELKSKNVVKIIADLPQFIAPLPSKINKSSVPLFCEINPGKHLNLTFQQMDSQHEFDKKRYTKVIMNSVVGGLSVETHRVMKNIFKDKDGNILEKESQIAVNLIAEGILIARKNKVDLTEQDGIKMHTFLINNTVDHHPSLYQDWSNGLETEIESLNGWFVKQGNLLNIDTPCQLHYYNLVRQGKKDLISK